MATLDVAFKQRTDDVVVLQTFVPSGIQVADSVTVAAVGDSMDGTFDVISTEPYELTRVDEWGNLIFDYSVILQNQVIYKSVGDAVERQAVTAGTITYTESVQWITPGDVLSWLGINPATQNDVDFLAMVTQASNDWCYRKRREAGFTDSQATAPGADVKLGAILYAAMNYRERGAVDGYASFDAMGNPVPSMSVARIMQLLGCGKPQVG